MTYFYWYAGLSVLLTTLLAMNVSRVRMKEKVGNGDGGNAQLRRAIRAHMNTVEHTLPYGLIVLALAQMNTSGSTLIAFTFGFLITRLLNSYSMLNSKFRIRQITAGVTYLFQLVGCVTVLVSL